MFHALPQDTADVVTLKSPCIFPAPSSRKWMEVGRCVPSNRFRQFFWCSNSTVGHGGIQLRDGNSLGMEELGKFVGVFGELGLDLWILDRPGGVEGSDSFNLFQYIVMLWDVLGCFCLPFCGCFFIVGQGSAMRHFRPNQHGSEPKVPDLGDSSGLCFLHLGPNLHLGRRLRSDTDVSFVSIQQRHHLHDNMVDRCMYLPVLLDPVPLWQERIRIALCDRGLSYFIIHHDWHHAFKTPQTCQYHLVMGNYHHHPFIIIIKER